MKARAMLFLVPLAAICAVSAFAQTTDLVTVVTTGTIQDVQAAIDKGADVNFQQADTGITPLIAAAKYNQDVVPVLLKAGAKTIARDTQYGGTVLMWAVVYDRPEIVKVLIAAGADINAVGGGGYTPLMWAAQVAGESIQNTEITKVLLSRGVDVNARNNDGDTALMLASKGNSSAVVMLLLNAGADAKVKDALGNTALSYAKYNSLLEDTPVFKQLEEASQ